MQPDSTIDQEPRLFAVLQRNDERALPGDADPTDVAVQLGFDSEGAYLQIVDAKGRPRDVNHRAARGALRDLLKAPPTTRPGGVGKWHGKISLSMESAQDGAKQSHAVV